MNYSLNSLKGLYRGLYRCTTIMVIKGDTRSLDYSSHEMCIPCSTLAQPLRPKIRNVSPNLTPESQGLGFRV